MLKKSKRRVQPLLKITLDPPLLYFYWKVSFTLSWCNVDCRSCFVVVIVKFTWHRIIFFHLTCPDRKKGFNFHIRVSGAGKETSLCMKEVSFWAVASHEWRGKQETIQQERKLKEWNISLQRQTNLKFKCCLIYYNGRYRSVHVYWLEYHPSRRFQLYVCARACNMLITLKSLNCSPGMLNPVLNQFKIIILYFCTLHAVLYCVAALQRENKNR